MKKTLAILLSCMLVVGVMFALFITSSADEPATEIFASTIQVRVPDGADDDLLADVIYVGRQPLFEDAEDPAKITGYSNEVKNNPLTLGSGTLTLDAATGTVTIENISNVVGIHSFTGSMTLVVKGTNTIDATVDPDGEGEGTAPVGNNIQVNFYQAANAEAGTPEYRGNLTIKGDGVLNTKTNAYGIVCNEGGMEVTDKVTINGETNGSGNVDVLHVAKGPVSANNPSDLVISGSAKLNLVCHGAGVRSAALGAIVIKDDVVIDIDSTKMNSWGGAIACTNLEMISGKVDISVVDGASAAITGVNVQGGVANFIGGEMKIVVNHTSNSRPYGLFFKNDTAVNFIGTDIDLTVKSSASATNNAIMGFQGTVGSVNYMGGTLKVDGDANTCGLFGMNTVTTINITGGEITGTGSSFAYSQGVNITLNILSAKIDWTSLKSNYTSTSTKEFVQTAAATGAPAWGARYVLDPAAKTFKADIIAAPTNVAAGTVTKDDAPLTWAAVTEAIGYNIYANGKLVNDTPITETSYVVPVMPNTEYELVVAAVNPLGGENAAAAVTVTTPDGVSSRVVPAAPAGLILNGADATSAVISWNAVEGVDGYNVYVGTEKVNEALITDTAYAFSALEAGAELDVTVKAVNLVGESEASAAVKVAPVVSENATLVKVTLADGSLVALGSGKTSATIGTGTIALDAATGVVTVTDVKDVQSIIATKKMTVVFKGTNTIGTNAPTNVLKADDLVVEGDGTVTVDANKATYPVIGNANVTLQGSVKMTITAPAASSVVHAARKGGDCTILVKDNFVLKSTGAGRAFNAAGEKSSIIVTGNADVTLDSAGDAIQAIFDKDVEEYTGAAGAYVEVSGNAKLTVTKGNCGIRCSVALKNTEIAATSQVIFKDNAKVDITAPGQTVYVVDASDSTNKGKNLGTFTVAGNAQVKLTNNGPASNGSYYPALQLNTDGNTLNVTGGTLELIVASDSSANAYKVSGKPTYNIKGYKTFVGGADAASATDIEAFGTSYKYMKISFGNPGTSDFTVVAAASAAALAALMGLAIVVLRKKAHN